MKPTIIVLGLLLLVAFVSCARWSRIPTDSQIDELMDQYNALSDAELASGTSLSVTATSLNVRSGACTDRSIVKSIPQGTIVTFTGEVVTACGNTW